MEAEVYGIEEKGNTLVSKATVTMAALEQRLPEGYRPVATRISGPREAAVYRAERRSMGFQSLKYELEDGVARLTLSCPPRNSIGLTTGCEPVQVTMHRDEDKRVRAVLISTEGAMLVLAGISMSS